MLILSISPNPNSHPFKKTPTTDQKLEQEEIKRQNKGMKERRKKR
jgi:hypothetical protein